MEEAGQEEAVAAEEDDGKCRSWPVSEESWEQQRRSTVWRDVQRRKRGTHCSDIFTQPARLR